MVRVESTANLSVLRVLVLMKRLVIPVQSKVPLVVMLRSSDRTVKLLRTRYANAQLTLAEQVLPI